MDRIVDSAAKIIFPAAIVMGAYVALHGHLTPGGGFPGGTIMATGFVLVMIVLGEKSSGMQKTMLTGTIKGVAYMAFMLVIIAGLRFRWDILQTQRLFDVWSGGFTIFTNVLGSVMVAIALSSAFYYLSKVAE